MIQWLSTLWELQNRECYWQAGARPFWQASVRAHAQAAANKARGRRPGTTSAAAGSIARAIAAR